MLIEWSIRDQRIALFIKSVCLVPESSTCTDEIGSTRYSFLKTTCSLTLLNQGSERGLGFKEMIVEYLVVQYVGDREHLLLRLYTGEPRRTG